MTKVGARVAPGAGDSKLRSEGGPSGGGGSKKSDKTMERNLNYAPRKMAIVCKAMLIRQRRKGAGADSADAARRRSRRFLLHRAEIVSLLPPPLPFPSSSFFLSLSSTVPSVESRSLRLRCFLHTLRTVSPSPPVGLLSGSSHLRSSHSSPRSLDLSSRCIIAHLSHMVAVI